MASKYAIAFAENLKELLKATSVRELSEATKIPHQTISRYLNCTREIKLEYLCRIADYFNESVDFLIGRSEY